MKSSVLTQLIVDQVGDIESYFGMFRWATVEKVHGATEDRGGSSSSSLWDFIFCSLKGGWLDWSLSECYVA